MVFYVLIFTGLTCIGIAYRFSCLKPNKNFTHSYHIVSVSKSAKKIKPPPPSSFFGEDKGEIFGKKIRKFISTEHLKKLKNISLGSVKKNIHSSDEIKYNYEELRLRKKLPLNKQPFSWLSSEGVFMEEALHLNKESLYVDSKNGNWFTGVSNQKNRDFEEINGECPKLTFHLPYKNLSKFDLTETAQYQKTNYLRLFYKNTQQIFDAVSFKTSKDDQKMNLDSSKNIRKNPYFLLNLFIKKSEEHVRAT
ncbi:MAG: hypothetical protein ACTSXV_02305 [Alphaproteobacteria bacterium]